MKATGIVRRIDELGRVVIPKEIRRTQRIRRGDPLEIFTTGDGEVIFKKYSPMGELSGVTAQYVDVLSKCFALTAFVSDRDRILAASGAGRRDLADRSVSQPLEKLMDSRKPYQSPGAPEKTLLPCEGAPRVLLCAAPVLAGGDVTGAVGLLTEDRAACPDDAQCKAVAVAAASKRHCCPVRAHPGRCCALCPSLRRGMSPAVWACLRRTALPSPMPPSSRR